MCHSPHKLKLLFTFIETVVTGLYLLMPALGPCSCGTDFQVQLTSESKHRNLMLGSEKFGKEQERRMIRLRAIYLLSEAWVLFLDFFPQMQFFYILVKI